MRRPTPRAAAAFLAAWIPALLLVLIFTPAALAKFSDDSGWAAAFRHWGYPDWFRVLVGVVELLAVVCLLWGRTAILGALLVCAVMLGGMGTHAVFDHGRHMTSEIVPLVLAGVILLTRRRQLATLAAARRGPGSGRPASALRPSR
jgi:putative oxidoreductase